MKATVTEAPAPPGPSFPALYASKYAPGLILLITGRSDSGAFEGTVVANPGQEKDFPIGWHSDTWAENATIFTGTIRLEN